MLLKAHAKINLLLDVLSKRDDGYHELIGIMHTVDIFDTVGIMPSLRKDIIVECNELLPKNNTAYRAASAYLNAAGIDEGVDITIEKHIPSQAGMGGASADAAAVLCGLQSSYRALDDAKLYEIGKSVGADVPFCLHGGCAVVGGIGEKLETLPQQNLYLLLVQGSAGISTPHLFSTYDNVAARKETKANIESAITACKTFNGNLLCENLYNALEFSAFELLPELKITKQRLLDTGAINALMTGSGSVVYGVYGSLKDALRAKAQMQVYGYGFLEVTTTQNKGIRFI